MRACIAIAATALFWMPLPASSAPLEQSACAGLKSEHQKLVSDGAKDDMKRGADWAKSNLAAERLAKIERIITVEEQLSFRCGEALTARPELKEPPPEQKAAAAGPSGIPPPKRKPQKK